MVSRKVFRSVISSGILLSILFKEVDLRLSSWNASSDRAERYSTTKNLNFKIFLYNINISINNKEIINLT